MHVAKVTAATNKGFVCTVHIHRGASGGVLYMEFHTDKVRRYPITCGAGGALLPGSIPAGGAAVECESLSQGELTRGPTARVATAAL
jgi:hypothetical protein